MSLKNWKGSSPYNLFRYLLCAFRNSLRIKKLSWSLGTLHLFSTVQLVHSERNLKIQVKKRKVHAFWTDFSHTNVSASVYIGLIVYCIWPRLTLQHVAWSLAFSVFFLLLHQWIAGNFSRFTGDEVWIFSQCWVCAFDHDFMIELQFNVLMVFDVNPIMFTVRSYLYILLAHRI